MIAINLTIVINFCVFNKNVKYICDETKKNQISFNNHKL
jgi:hypothetical protein